MASGTPSSDPKRVLHAPTIIDPTVADVETLRELVRRGEKGRGFFCKTCGANLNEAMNSIPNDGRSYAIRCRCKRLLRVDAGRLAVKVILESQRMTRAEVH